MATTTNPQEIPVFTVTRIPAHQYTAERAEVRVTLPSGSSRCVIIYGPEIRFGSLSPAEVNWSAIGSVGPEDALAYAGTIALAASIAPTLAPATGKVEVNA